MANGFKTSFVGKPTSFSQLGGAAGQRIGSSIEKVFNAAAVQKQNKLKQAEAKYGFDKADLEIIPSGIEPRFRSGLQSYLNDYVSLAANSKQNPTSENINAYKLARQKYLEFKDVATTQSNFNRNTAVQIQKGQVKDMIGSVSENMNLYNKYRNGEGITQYYKDGTLYVVEDNVEKPWNQSTAFSASSVFVPPIEAKEAKYSVDKTQLDLVSKVLNPRKGALQVRDSQGFATGQIDKIEAAKIGVEFLNTRAETDAEQNTAISINAYNQNQKSGAGVTEEDITKAAVIYDAGMDNKTYEKEGRNINVATIIGLDDEGKALFSTTFDDIKENFDSDEAIRIMRWRDAKAAYYEASLNTSIGQIGVVDESGQKLRYNIQQQKADAKAKIAAGKEQSKQIDDLAKKYKNAPGLIRIEGGYEAPSNQKVVTSSGEESTVVGVDFNKEGNVFQYKIQKEIPVIEDGEVVTEMKASPSGAVLYVPVTETKLEIIDFNNPEFSLIDNVMRNEEADIISLGEQKVLVADNMSDYSLKNVGIPTKVLIGGAEESEAEESKAAAPKKIMSAKDLSDFFSKTSKAKEGKTSDVKEDKTIKPSGGVSKEFTDWLFDAPINELENYKSLSESDKDRFKKALVSGQTVYVDNNPGSKTQGQLIIK